MIFQWNKYKQIYQISFFDFCFNFLLSFFKFQSYKNIQTKLRMYDLYFRYINHKNSVLTVCSVLTFSQASTNKYFNIPGNWGIQTTNSDCQPEIYWHKHVPPYTEDFTDYSNITNQIMSINAVAFLKDLRSYQQRIHPIDRCNKPYIIQQRMYPIDRCNNPYIIQQSHIHS